MIEIWKILDQVRGRMMPSDVVRAVLAIAADKTTTSASLTNLSDIRGISASSIESVRPFLDAAAQSLLAQPVKDRFNTICDLFDRTSDPRDAMFWTHGPAADQIVNLLDGAKTVRFAGEMSFRSCLQFMFRMRDTAPDAAARFVWVNSEVSTLLTHVAIVLELDHMLTTRTAWPWDRGEASQSDAEVVMPSFGAQVRDDIDVPAKTLEQLGLTKDRRGRLTMDNLCIADALVNATGRVILSVPQGAMFRMVGTEVTAREVLLDSGRLQAVMAVATSMLFPSTGIATNLVVLAPKNEDGRHTVRFIDLGHDSIASRDARGRYTVRSGTDWGLLLDGPEPGDRTLARDISNEDVIANNFVMVPDRYLNTGPRERVEALLAGSEVAALGDLVEFIRPVTVQQSEDGDYTAHDASPSDVGRRGFVSKPARTLTVDRANYGKLFNQQLRPNDVVLSVKGTIGVAGLVPRDVPGEGEAEIWTAGQSLLILRVKPRAGMDPVALYEFLSNPTVQEYIGSLASGTAVQNIGMKDLKALPIPVPTAQTMAEVRAGFEERQAVFDEIEQLESRLQEMREAHWPHRDLHVAP